MKRNKRILVLLIIIISLFLLCSCKNKFECDIIYNAESTRVEDFKLSDIKLHIKNKKVDTLVDVTKDMLSAEDIEKLKTAGNHTITINFKSYSKTIDISLIGQSGDGVYFDMPYYALANGYKGQELKLALRSIISIQTKTEKYDDLRTDLAKTDKGSTEGTIICFYCQKEMDAKWDGGKTWNREHVWPQSLGWFSTTMAGADLHHLRPCHQSENSSRNNTLYGVSLGYYEPKDSVKGDVARILFYLYVRYQEADRYPLNTVCESFDMLLLWNDLDPVDSLEKQRNELAYSIQGNRNPFIDYPDYADYIWGTLS